MKSRFLRRELPLAAVFLLITALLLNFASDVLRPAHTDYGSTWSAFRAEPEDSLDVIYLGSSYAYCDFNPSVVYGNSGLTGYVMAGSEQTLSITYWYLKEVFKTQSPSAVVLEATSLFFAQYQNYTQLNIDLMPFSLNKLGAIFTAAEPELRTGLLFDLWFYHGRWPEIRPGDIRRALFPIQRDYLKGFTAIDEVKEGVGVEPYVADREVSDEDYAANLSWLAKILDLCAEHGTTPIITFNPTYTRCTQETYERIGREIQALDENVIFCNWSEMFEEIGLVPTAHLYDGGHLNQDGAAVFSAWLGEYLTEEAGLVPREQTAGNAAHWQESAQWWEDYLKN